MSYKPNNRIYLCLAHMSEAGLEQQYVNEAFTTHWVAPLGPNVAGFEQDLEEFVGCRKHIAVLSSCTAALHLALRMLGVGNGDEVLCQSFSFCASTHPITYCGACPVFIDSEPDTWNIDPMLLETAINDRIRITGKKPKAIIVVDLYGMPAKWDELKAISEKYGIPIIEDAANAMGSCYGGKPCGSFGQLATFSFNGNKIITTSGGGALVCHDEATKQRAIFMATQARENAPYYQHETIGFNYRLSNVCAGIGRGQMTVLGEHVNHHKHVHELYKKLLGEVEGILVKDNPSDRYDSNFWLTTVTIAPSIQVKGQEGPFKTYSDCEPNGNVEALRVFLDKAGVEARPLWKPMHKQPVYKDAPAYVNGVSESLFKVGMCLPSGPYVSDEDVYYIVDCIKEAIA
ncbi:MAG: DegT/DnrJ/EryC1/StrS family aminotransferase [Bacteroidales bacterium]|nr:DegT/DnrJ/EryC1/StrS family aminotransferase [Bacteroidales bacterium]